MTRCRKICRSPLCIIIIILMLTVIIILLHRILQEYFAANDRRNSIQDDENEQLQSPPTLESPILNTTPTPIINWKRIARSSLPWYFEDGMKIPFRAQINSKFGLKNVQIWPEEQQSSDSDRVEEQLMFVPSDYQYENAPTKKILLYNNFNEWMVDLGIDEFRSKDCPVNRCMIISKQSKSREVDAIIFRDKYHYPGHNNIDGQIWILFSIESAYYTELEMPKNAINWTVTYRHDSDIVMPYGRWAYYNSSVTQAEQLKWNYAQYKTKKVAMFVTNCTFDNGGLQYARKLGFFISVDIYGKCRDLEMVDSNDFFETMDRDYKFYLAFENSNCIDYVTEKFFVEGLQHDVLPIVMGGRREDYERMAPRRSYVHVDDYESPEQLAEYLHRLDADDGLYNEYFRWKGTGEFIDTRFFCRLCAMLHDKDAPAKHYENVNDWWGGKRVCNDGMKWDTDDRRSSPEV